MRMWSNNSVSRAEHGCMTSILVIIGLIIAGMLMFPEMGLFAPVASGITFFGGYFICRRLFRWIDGYEDSFLPVYYKRQAKINNYVLYIPKIKTVIRFDDIVEYSGLLDMFTVNHKSSDKVVETKIVFSSDVKFRKFMSDFEKEYDEYKKLIETSSKLFRLK